MDMRTVSGGGKGGEGQAEAAGQAAALQMDSDGARRPRETPGIGVWPRG